VLRDKENTPALIQTKLNRPALPESLLFFQMAMVISRLRSTFDYATADQKRNPEKFTQLIVGNGI